MIDGRPQGGGLFVGILLTAIGVIFLLDQMEIVHAAYIFQVFWPLVLIALGVSILIRTNDFRGAVGTSPDMPRARSSTGFFWGPALILIGGILLLSNLTNFAVDRLWPLWLVALGAWILLNRDRYDEIRIARRRRRAWRRYGPYGNWQNPGPGPSAAAGPNPPPGSAPNPTSAGFAGQGAGGYEYWANEHGQYGVGSQPPPGATGSPAGAPGTGPGPGAPFAGPGYPPPFDSADDTFDRSVIFMSFNRRITSRRFRYGKISAVFGGFHIDFTGADMEGNQAVLQIEAVFGGGEIRVPPTWRVSITGHEVAGAIVDETTALPDAAAPAKLLIIHGTTVFGGVVIKN